MLTRATRNTPCLTSTNGGTLRPNVSPPPPSRQLTYVSRSVHRVVTTSAVQEKSDKLTRISTLGAVLRRATHLPGTKAVSVRPTSVKVQITGSSN